MAAAVTKAKKPKSSSAPKSRNPPLHPPYIEMIADAIATLKDRTGSSIPAITKVIEGKYKNLPDNYKKLMSTQLKKGVAGGKIVKVKASYKLPPKNTPATTAPAKKTKAPAKKPAAKTPAKKKAVTTAAKPKAAPKAKPAAKPKAVAAPKAKPAAKAKAKAVAKPKTPVKPAAKAAKTSTRSTPGRSAAVSKGVTKKAPVKKAVAAKPKKAVAGAKKGKK